MRVASAAPVKAPVAMAVYTHVIVVAMGLGYHTNWWPIRSRGGVAPATSHLAPRPAVITCSSVQAAPAASRQRQRVSPRLPQEVFRTPDTSRLSRAPALHTPHSGTLPECLSQPPSPAPRQRFRP